jgi:hypothetical protein
MGVVRHRVPVANVRENFRQQKRRVRIAERVVLGIPVLGLAWVDEDTDRYGHFASVDQIVEDNGNADFAVRIQVHAAVLEDHQRRGLRIGVLRRHVHPVAAVGAAEDPARVPLVLEDRAARNIGLRKRVGPVRVADGLREVCRLTNVRGFGHGTSRSSAWVRGCAGEGSAPTGGTPSPSPTVQAGPARAPASSSPLPHREGSRSFGAARRTGSR